MICPVATLQQLEDQNSWQKRYRQLTRWAQLLTRKPSIRREQNRVTGCETDVWLQHQEIAGRHRFAIDTDSRVIQGLSVLVLLLLDNKTESEIKAVDMEAIFADLGLEKYLSASRNNGFRSLVDAALKRVC